MSNLVPIAGIIESKEDGTNTASTPKMAAIAFAKSTSYPTIVLPSEPMNSAGANPGSRPILSFPDSAMLFGRTDAMLSSLAIELTSYGTSSLDRDSLVPQPLKTGTQNIAAVKAAENLLNEFLFITLPCRFRFPSSDPLLQQTGLCLFFPFAEIAVRHNCKIIACRNYCPLIAC